MAAMQFSCPHCSGLFQVDSSLGGQQVSCPHCRGVVVLPAMAGYPPPGAAPGISERRGSRLWRPGDAGAAPRSGAGVHARRPGATVSAAEPRAAVSTAPGFPPQPQAPAGQERPLAGPQPQRPSSANAGRDRRVGDCRRAKSVPLGGPAQGPLPQVPPSQRPVVPQRPAPLSQPAGQQPAGSSRSLPPPGPAARAGSQSVPAAPTTPAVPSKPVVPTAPKPAAGDVERRIPAAPRRPEMPLSRRRCRRAQEPCLCRAKHLWAERDCR